MTEKVNCLACGTLILPTTAGRNGGLCVPCKKGYRESVNSAKSLEKERERKRKEWESSPSGVYLTNISNIAYSSETGFFDLSESDQKYLAVCLLDGEVNNGGFHQFFFNSPGGYYSAAVAGLIEIGAMKSALLLKEAKELLFGQAPVPADTISRRSILPGVEPNPMPPQASTKLYELDKQYWDGPDDIFKLLDEFAELKCLYPRL